MTTASAGTPYDELHQLPIFGVLAHSHAWKSNDKTPMFDIAESIHNVVDQLAGARSPIIDHPRFMVDIICVADTATYTLKHFIQMGPVIDVPRRESFGDDPDGGLESRYEVHWESAERGYDTRGELLGSLIHELTTIMAYHDPGLRKFADYLGEVGVWGGIGKIHQWSPVIFSQEVRATLMNHGANDLPWSKWGRNL